MTQGFSIDVSGVMASALATGLFVSLCTIQTPSTAVVGAGQRAISWSNLTGHVAIRCMAPPMGTENKIDSSERKGLGHISDYNDLHVLLEGYYPLIQARYRAVIDGTAYDITAAESDSQGQMTRLAVRKASL